MPVLDLTTWEYVHYVTQSACSGKRKRVLLRTALNIVVELEVTV